MLVQIDSHVNSSVCLCICLTVCVLGGAGIEYFNTFGGNSVACAIGEAVLDTIANEDLLAHTQRVGAYLSSHLQQLRCKYPRLLGDIRGCGLFQGIEFIRLAPCLVCQENLTSTDVIPVHVEENDDLAQFVVDYLQQHRVVASRDANVIKLKPPLVIQETDIDILLLHLDGGIAEWNDHRKESKLGIPS